MGCLRKHLRRKGAGVRLSVGKGLEAEEKTEQSGGGRVLDLTYIQQGSFERRLTT